MKTVNQQLLARKRERMKPLSEHKRINELLRNEFVSELISAVNRAYIQMNLSISTLTQPTENSQPTSSRSKTLRNHYRKTCTYTIIKKHTQKLVIQNEIVPQKIPAVEKASLHAELSIARLTRPKENKQLTTFCPKTPRNHYRKT